MASGKWLTLLCQSVYKEIKGDFHATIQEPINWGDQGYKYLSSAYWRKLKTLNICKKIITQAKIIFEIKDAETQLETIEQFERGPIE